jgi:OmpA-OmpF porin, OOP family
MSLRNLFLTTSAMALFAGAALADGGPAPQPPPPPPPPQEQPYTPPPPAYETVREDIWYAALHGGAVWLSNNEILADGDLYEIDTDTGWAAGGALGYRYGNGFRAEFEGTWRDNEGGFYLFDPGPVLLANAEIGALNLMLNALYDFNMNMGKWFSPYAGAGIGTARINVRLFDDFEEVEDDGWAFAYQFIGGFSSGMPNTAIELFADYRYLRTAGLDLLEGSLQEHDEYVSHTVLGGVRFNF